MTSQEQALADDKMRAEIARIAAETSKINQERNEKLQAEIAKLVAETAKLNSENRWYPLIIGSTATLAIVAIVKMFL